jgi:hypothetical protein
MSGWAIPMLIAGGLFAGGASFFARERIPTWPMLGPEEFQPDFARSINRADRLQPALLVATIVSTVGFAISASGTVRTLAFIAAGGYALTLAGSGVLLVPLQRRLIAVGCWRGRDAQAPLVSRSPDPYRGRPRSFALTAVAVATAL